MSNSNPSICPKCDEPVDNGQIHRRCALVAIAALQLEAVSHERDLAQWGLDPEGDR